MSKPANLPATLLQNASALQLMDAFEKENHGIRFIGGAVRDSLLGRELHDIDLATTSVPEKSLQILEKNNIRAIPTGLKYGTVTAVLNGKNFEITTLRKDIATYGRDADVAFTDDWEQDAERRDFTVNALSADRQGKLYDYCGGLDDLHDKKLQFIGNPEERIKEDYLRILRYFRFASQLEWRLDDTKTLEICKYLAPELKNLSRERIHTEIVKLLVGANAAYVVRKMHELTLWHVLVGREPNIDRFERLAAMEESYGEPCEAQPCGIRRSMALFGYDDDTVLERFLVPSNKEKKIFEAMRRLKQYKDSNRSLQRQLYDFGEIAVQDFYYLEGDPTVFGQIATWKKPIFPLKAADIMKFNRGPDHLIGSTLAAAENYWIDNGFQTPKSELLTMAINFLNKESNLD